MKSFLLFMSHSLLKQQSKQEFIVVAHDVWDGKRKQLNGVTVFFTDPRDLNTYRIPVALTPPDGKKSIDLCRTTWKGLTRFGIKSNDVVRAVNDNCTTAKRAGRL